MSEVLEFPPIDAGVPAPAAASALPVAQPLTVKQAVLALFSPMEKDLAALSERYRAVAFDVTTPKGLKAAKEARHDLRENGRYAVQRMRDQAKKALNEGKSAAEAEADRLIAIVQPREDEIDKLITNREQELERERQAEEARQEKHRSAIATIRNYASQAQTKALTSERLADGIAYVEGIDVSAAVFEEFADEAALAKEATLAVLRELHARAIEAERLAAEQERQRLENERVARELAEQQRQLAEQAAALRRQQQELEAAQARAAAPAAAVAAADTPACVAGKAENPGHSEPEAAPIQRSEEAPAQATFERSPGLAAQSLHPITPDAQESGSLPAAAGAYASSEAEAAQVSPSGDVGKVARADEGAALPDLSLNLGAIETSEREAIDPGPITMFEPLATADEQAHLQLLEVQELLLHLGAAFQTRFPSHPKPEQSWWAALRDRMQQLAPKLEVAIENWEA